MNLNTLSNVKTKEIKGLFVDMFKHMFPVFKQHYKHFYTLFHPHVSYMFSNNKTHVPNTSKSKEIRGDQTQIKPNIQHGLQYNHSDLHMFYLYIFFI